MNRYPFDRPITNESELLDYYINAIYYRTDHKDASAAIAMHVFDATHPDLKLSFPISEAAGNIRNEFGALEAPGMPDDDMKDPDEYMDDLWNRLHNLIIQTKEKQTV